MKMKLIFVLVLSFLFSTGALQQCATPQQPVHNPAPADTGWTNVSLPFHPDAEHSDWQMTQCFGAYYADMGGAHSGEDWVCDGDRSTASVYPIAAGTGTIVWYGKVNSSDRDFGYYIVVKFTGNFKIPASSGPHLQALKEPVHNTYHGYYGEGGHMISYLDLFSSGTLTDYPFLDPSQTSSVGGAAADGRYSYGDKTISTIYSVYMHLASNPAYGEPGPKNIPVHDVNASLGTLVKTAYYSDGKTIKHSAHLHFEIRDPGVADLSNGFFSNVGGNSNGYFPDSQKIVDNKYREPSSFLQANGAQGSITGQVLGIQSDVQTMPPDNLSDADKKNIGQLIQYVREAVPFDDVDQIDKERLLWCAYRFETDINNMEEVDEYSVRYNQQYGYEGNSDAGNIFSEEGVFGVLSSIFGTNYDYSRCKYVTQDTNEFIFYENGKFYINEGAGEHTGYSDDIKEVNSLGGGRYAILTNIIETTWDDDWESSENTVVGESTYTVVQSPDSMFGFLVMSANTVK